MSRATPALSLLAVDTHTEGGSTRVILAGLPELAGSTVGEQMVDFSRRHDSIRKLLVREPRGHPAMFLALLVQPVDPRARVGVFFASRAGYLSTCIHSTIGAACAVSRASPLKAPDHATTALTHIETPDGVLGVRPVIVDDRLVAFAVAPPPVIVPPDARQSLLGLGLTVSMVHCGVPIALVDAQQLLLRDARSREPIIRQDRVGELTRIATRVIEHFADLVTGTSGYGTTSRCPRVVMIYERSGERSYRNLVVDAFGTIDRSPCGAGSAALAAYLLDVGHCHFEERIRIESLAGTHFDVIVRSVAQHGVERSYFTEVQGSAHVIAISQLILDADDPLVEGLSQF